VSVLSEDTKIRYKAKGNQLPYFFILKRDVFVLSRCYRVINSEGTASLEISKTNGCRTSTFLFGADHIGQLRVVRPMHVVS
jgi:hypothetical protein